MKQLYLRAPESLKRSFRLLPWKILASRLYITVFLCLIFSILAFIKFTADYNIVPVIKHAQLIHCSNVTMRPHHSPNGSTVGSHERQVVLRNVSRSNTKFFLYKKGYVASSRSDITVARYDPVKPPLSEGGVVASNSAVVREAVRPVKPTLKNGSVIINVKPIKSKHPPNVSVISNRSSSTAMGDNSLKSVKLKLPRNGPVISNRSSPAAVGDNSLKSVKQKFFRNSPVISNRFSSAVVNNSLKPIEPKLSKTNQVISNRSSSAAVGDNSLKSVKPKPSRNSPVISNRSRVAAVGDNSLKPVKPKLAPTSSVISNQSSSAVVGEFSTETVPQKNGSAGPLLSKNSSVIRNDSIPAMSGDVSMMNSLLSQNRSDINKDSNSTLEDAISEMSSFSENGSVVGNHSTKIPVVSMAGKTVKAGFFQTVISPSVSCSGRDIELVICVPVKRDGAAQREAIRLTWGSYGRNGGRSKVNTTGETILVFFIGSSSLLSSQDEQESIEKEAEMYGDIYQADYVDTYENLTLKSISILEFVSSRCPEARYVAKIDDDMYVNIPLLLTQLRKRTKMLSEKAVFDEMNKHTKTSLRLANRRNHSNIVTNKKVLFNKAAVGKINKHTISSLRLTKHPNHSNIVTNTKVLSHKTFIGKINEHGTTQPILTSLQNQSNVVTNKTSRDTNYTHHAPPFAFGLMFKKANVVRDPRSKWFTPKDVYNVKVYPNYLSGTAYAMSGLAALRLYQASQKVPFFWMEDVYVTGMCAQEAQVHLFGDNRLFSTNRKTTTGCGFRHAISSHQFTANELKAIHAQFIDPTLKCEEEQKAARRGRKRVGKKYKKVIKKQRKKER